ncbi:cytochrome C [Azoarcus taiwanensis]|uniref:Cytochrome C n=1 Tax=Azoarcus taiwanensis TaxID=666964 RepID=A0A972F8K7_9RHOO|nr:cytochrome C [Azoarcus taiwanensis]
MKIKTLLLFTCLVGLGAPALADDPNLARNLAATCANCHGTNGHAVDAGTPGTMGALAGVPAEDLMTKLSAFRADLVPATIMHQIAKGFTEEQLQLIAEYFAAQPR